MSRESVLVIEGVVTAGDASVPFAGAVVRVHVPGGKQPAASCTSDQLGCFSVTLAIGRQVRLRGAAKITFAVARSAKGAPMHAFPAIALAALPKGPVRLRVPEAALEKGLGRPKVSCLVDGETARSVAIGQSIALLAAGLRPCTTYQLMLAAGRADRLQQSVASDARGAIASLMVLEQFGLTAWDSQRRHTIEEARKHFAGGSLAWQLRHGKRVVASGTLSVARALRPLAFVSNERGELQNAVQADRDDLVLTVASAPRGRLRAFLVPRQGTWNPGDAVVPGRDAQGRALVFDLDEIGADGVVRVARAGRIPPGAYDVVVRPMRYGFEVDELLRLHERDIVIGRGFTGLVVREEFWSAKPVLGGCVNAFPMSGSLVSGQPYFRYRDTFAIGENVLAAMDPGIVMPGQMGKKVAFYVVASKTAAQWTASTALAHVAPVGPLERILQGGCINANEALIWPSANQVGTFDIVADFGNNDPNPAAFVADGNFNTPVDMIDGYFAPGFRVVADPGTLSEWANVGAFNVDAAFLTGLGLGATMTVQDENNSYFTPGGFVAVNVNITRLAIVRFPADVAGATSPSQISSAQASYPLVVVVHGNGHTYTNYAFLLEHLARNGFIAVSIHMQGGLNGLARANAFFDHLTTINLAFGSTVQNNVAVLGHSRGGEAVFKIARLNQSLGLGIGLSALMALGPTDQYGRETITGAAARPLFVLYGAKDDDVSGWPPYSGYNVRQTGFSLYDRFDSQDKSMVFVHDATHNGFVTHNEVFGTAPVPPLMTVADQQKILLAYVNAFCRMHLRNEPQWVGMFTGEWRPPAVGATGAVMAVQYRNTTRRTVDQFEGPHAAGDWATSTIGDVASQSGLPADPVETQLFPQDNQSPHDTGGLRLVWDQIGDQLVFDMPAGQRNVTGFTHLSIRLGKVVNSAANPAGQQNLRVGLRDGGGNERLIRVAAFGGIADIATANEVGNTKSSMCTVRIPLTAYTVVCAGAVQVDLTDVVKVKVAFTEKATGEVAVDELEFCN